MALERVHNGENLEEVIKLLDKYSNDAKIIAGGTDIVISLRNGKIQPKILIDITKINELKTIKDEGDYITIGGGVTFTQIVESDLFKGNLHGLEKACSMVGSPQIRNKGTIGGNIANGSSAADSIPPLICLDAIITLESLGNTREILLKDYYDDQIKEKELLTKIRFRKPRENQIVTFSKLGLRKALAISRLTISAFIDFDDYGFIKDAKIASGALGKYPMREIEVEEYLIGKEVNEKTIEGSIDTLKSSMDIRLKGRSTLSYKRTAIYTILRETLEAALEFKNGVR
jgi:carbon-monoxide dehydrogenase medium subunit/xanthine dehydrogenase FAD-binding subunit